jgi:hypothetical protein
MSNPQLKSEKLQILGRYIFLLLVFLTSLFVAKSVRATVHINEILPNPEGDDNKDGAGKEWVELYNDADEKVNLAGWILVDKAGNEKSLDGLGEIGSKSYKVYEVEAIQGWMNNSSGDTLWLKNSEGEQHGREFNYGSDPGEGVTLGRWPDGSDTWSTMKSVTKGNSNSGPEPTTTPTPENTPTPAASPTPEATPTPTQAPSPTRRPPTITPAVRVKVDGDGEDGEDGEPSVSDLRDQVLGENTKEGEDEGDNNEGGGGVDWLVLVLVGGGAILLGGAGVVFWKSRLSKDNE